MKSETLAGIAKAASVPAGVISGAAVGIDWQEWVWIATFVWVVLQSCRLVWDWLIKPHVRKRT